MALPISRLAAWCVPASLSLALVACMAPHASGQGSQQADGVEIEPYDGPPIYLPEGDPPPPPVEVENQTVKQDYEGTDTPRFERGLIRYSDNSVKSDGVIKEYFSNGQLFVEGQFDEGDPTGEWTYYHKNGAVAKRMSFKEGRPDGVVELFTEEGKRLATRKYVDGKREGAWSYYDETGEKVIREEGYKAGKAHGEMKVWYQNGQLRQVSNFDMGSLNGVAKEWTQLGEPRAVAEFKKGKRHGKTTQWQPDGTVIERLYDEGKLVDQTEVEGSEG